MNPQIGTVPCLLCKGTAALHQMARGTRGLYYWNCTRCGCIQPTRDGAQKTIRDTATFYPDHKPREHKVAVPASESTETTAAVESPTRQKSREPIVPKIAARSWLWNPNE